MKPHKLLLILSFMLFSVGNTFAQNNDMKARMEFEDAETAYQSQNYSKAVTHLENTEKQLGKPTGKTRYLLILALNKNLTQDYEYQDLEKLKKLSKHYLDNYTADSEKYRDVYDLSNNLDKNYPKSLAEYNQIKQKKGEQQKRLSIEKKEREEFERAEKIKKAQKYVLDFAKRYNYQPNLTPSEFGLLSSDNAKLVKKEGRRKVFNNAPTTFNISNGKIIELKYVITYKEWNQEDIINRFNIIKNDIIKNLPPEYYVYTRMYNHTDLGSKIIINVSGINLDEIIINLSLYSGSNNYGDGVDIVFKQKK